MKRLLRGRNLMLFFVPDSLLTDTEAAQGYRIGRNFRNIGNGYQGWE